MPGDTADTLARLAGMLLEVAQVHRYDQRACGRSLGGPPFTMGQSLADLEAFRDHWANADGSWAGNSFGAGLALAFALEHPDRVGASSTCPAWCGCTGSATGTRSTGAPGSPVFPSRSANDIWSCAAVGTSRQLLTQC